MDKRKVRTSVSFLFYFYTIDIENEDFLTHIVKILLDLNLRPLICKSISFFTGLDPR